jgi:hypothetical protein
MNVAFLIPAAWLLVEGVHRANMRKYERQHMRLAGRTGQGHGASDGTTLAGTFDQLRSDLLDICEEEPHTASRQLENLGDKR